MVKVAGSNPAEPIPRQRVSSTTARKPFVPAQLPNSERGPLGRASVEGYGFFRRIANLVGRHPKLLVGVWVLIFAGAILANQVWRSGDVVSFSQSSTLPQDTESAQAQMIIDREFPGQGTGSSATIVVVAPDATSPYYRNFTADLHDTIVAASKLLAGQNLTLTLHPGGSFRVDRRIEFLRNPTNATVYGLYESFGYALAKQFNGPVHAQIGFTQAAVGIYWGLPATFVAAWMNATPAVANETAYAQTRAAINASFSPPTSCWAEASFETFYRTWRGAVSAPALDGAPGPPRAEAAIPPAAPALPDSLFGKASLKPTAQQFHPGRLRGFHLS